MRFFFKKTLKNEIIVIFINNNENTNNIFDLVIESIFYRQEITNIINQFTMSLKVKAIERLVKFSKEEAGTYRYVMQPELYNSLNQDKVIREAALRSGVSKGVMQACWDAAGEVIKAWATEGHSVALPGLGTMRFGLRAKSVEDVNDVKSSLIKSRRIIFTPSVELKDELANTAIQITCYDRNGNEVKRVTSSDDGTVEDNDGENNSGNSNSGNTGNGDTPGGGGDNGGSGGFDTGS